MRLLSIAIATALVGICGGPALAGECPMLQGQMERQVNNRLDSAAYNARESMKQASPHSQASTRNRVQYESVKWWDSRGPQEVAAPVRRRGLEPDGYFRGAACGTEG